MRLTGILGSDLIKNALDQRFILDHTEAISGKRQALLASIDSGSLLTLPDLLNELENITESAWRELEVWVKKHGGEAANVEKSKSRYIKLEKWNAVMQQK